MSAKPNPPWRMPGEKIVGQVTLDGGIHRRVTPTYREGSLAWLGEPMTESQAVRYEARRAAILESTESEVTP